MRLTKRLRRLIVAEKARRAVAGMQTPLASPAASPAATRAASPVALRSPQRAAQRAVGAASPAPRTPSPGGSSLRRAAPRSAASAATAEAELHSPEGECSFIYRYILREVLLTV